LLQQRICLWRRRIANGDNSQHGVTGADALIVG
jgi:hypothetical protein